MGFHGIQWDSMGFLMFSGGLMGLMMILMKFNRIYCGDPLVTCDKAIENELIM